MKSVADYKRAVKETTFGSLDISDVPDGVYAGEYDVNFVYAKNVNDDEHGQICGCDAGTVDYITKPFSIKALLRKIRVMFTMLDRREPSGDIYDDGKPWDAEGNFIKYIVRD